MNAVTTIDVSPPEPFDFNGNKVRCIIMDGEPWFAAPDIIACLGLRGDPWSVCRPLAMDEKRTIDTPKTLRGKKGGLTLTVVRESGLYKITLRAQTKNPIAEAFQNFVTREVLPSIRKTGRYEVAPRQEVLPALPAVPTSFAEALRLAADLEAQRELAVAKVHHLEEQREADLPKIEFAERFAVRSDKPSCAALKKGTKKRTRTAGAVSGLALFCDYKAPGCESCRRHHPQIAVIRTFRTSSAE